MGVQDDRFSDDILIVDDRGPRSGEVAALIDKLPDEYDTAWTETQKRLQALKERITEGCDGLGTQHFGGHFRNYLERQIKERPEFLDRILIWYPEDSLKVEYSPNGDGTGFRPIGQTSSRIDLSCRHPR